MSIEESLGKLKAAFKSWAFDANTEEESRHFHVNFHRHEIQKLFTDNWKNLTFNIDLNKNFEEAISKRINEDILWQFCHSEEYAPVREEIMKKVFTEEMVAAISAKVIEKVKDDIDKFAKDFASDVMWKKKEDLINAVDAKELTQLILAQGYKNMADDFWNRRR